MALSFLAEDWGFCGPELTADGVAYHRVGLHVEMGYWAWKNERGFTTTLAQVGIDGTERRAELGVLYAACGLGPAGAAPEGAGTLYVIRKRIVQHAMALRALIGTLMMATPMLCSDAAAAAHHGQPPEMTPCRDQVPRPCTDS